MRRILGAAFVLGSCYFLYQFAIWGAWTAGADLKPYNSSIPFRVLGLGDNYPFDVAMLMAATWAMLIGLYFILSPERSSIALPTHVPTTSRWAQRMASQQRSSPMASMFLLNALLLATTLFIAYIGAKRPADNQHTISVFSLVAGLQIATGFLLMVFAVFEKPKGGMGLIVGGAVYLAGTAVAAIVFLWGGQPAQA